VFTATEAATVAATEAASVAPTEAAAVAAAKTKGNGRSAVAVATIIARSTVAVVTWRGVNAAWPSTVASAVLIADQTYLLHIRVSGNQPNGKSGCRAYRKYCAAEGGQPSKCIFQFHLILLSVENTAEE
jgi:hypothetical protein